MRRRILTQKKNDNYIIYSGSTASSTLNYYYNITGNSSITSYNSHKRTVKSGYHQDGYKAIITEWDNVEGCKYMFYNQSNIEYLDLHLDFSKVKYTSNMFSNFSFVKEINMTNCYSDSVIEINSMFSGCDARKVVMPNIKSKVTTIGRAFYMTNLQYLDVSNLDISNAPIVVMFYSIAPLKYIKCKQSFKDICINNADVVKLPATMREGGEGVWDIVD